MKMALLTAGICVVILSSFATADDAVSSCEKGDMSKSMVRQSDLIGKWKQIGFEENGKVIKMNIGLTHEFATNCEMIVTMIGVPVKYNYLLEENRLTLTNELTKSNYHKVFSKVELNLIIHGGDVFERIK